MVPRLVNNFKPVKKKEKFFVDDKQAAEPKIASVFRSEQQARSLASISKASLVEALVCVSESWIDKLTRRFTLFAYRGMNTEKRVVLCVEALSVIYFFFSRFASPLDTHD